MIGQLLRWLIFATLLAAVLVAVFVAWWLALLLALAALALGALRRLFGSKSRVREANQGVILEGEYTVVEGEARHLPDRDKPAP